MSFSLPVARRLLPACGSWAALAVAIGLAAPPAHAQAGAERKASRAAPAKSTAKPSVAKARRTPAPAEDLAALMPPAPGEQVAAAALAYFGDYACEFDESVNVSMNARHDGYLDVRHRSRVYTMKPVLSSTGAVRLEDVRGQMLMIQIATKSMLMDTRIGRRVVDNCQHERQRLALAPAQDQGIGIDPNKPAASAAPVSPTAPAAADRPIAAPAAAPSAAPDPAPMPAAASTPTAAPDSAAAAAAPSVAPSVAPAAPAAPAAPPEPAAPAAPAAVDPGAERTAPAR